MDVLAFLYGIPVIGLVFQFVAYFISVFPAIAPIMMQAAIPLAFAALCGVICERSGVVNIGIEGTMLTAAFVGWAGGIFLVPILGKSALPLFGANPALIGALVLAILAGVLVALLHAWLSISVRADQIIAGTIINIAAFGVTGYLNTLIAPSSPAGAGKFEALTLPASVTDAPFVGWLARTLFDQGPIGVSLLVVVVVFQVLLFRSRWGLRTRAVGEHPRAAETVGIDVIRLRYRNVLAGGVLAALGGAYLSMELSGSFQAGMTVGRGYIGLAAMIVGRWTPIGGFAAAILFASSVGIGQSIRIAPPTGELIQLGALLGGLPRQVFDALPYIVTIIILAGVIGRSIPPAADGQPYEREASH
jgi:general nucleoside transport system permease protein